HLDLRSFPTRRSSDLQGQRVSDFGSSPAARSQFHTYLQTVRCKDVAFFSICINQQGNPSTPVGVVLNGFYLCQNTVFISFEIDYPVLPFVSTSKVAHGHFTCVVTTTALLQRLQQGFLWYT